jgi:hypothetical protein
VAFGPRISPLDHFNYGSSGFCVGDFRWIS